MNTKACLYPDERLDDLQRNGYKIIQNPNKFCFGMDAVLLSYFADIKKEAVSWILEPEPASSLSCWLPRQMPNPLKDWKFRKKVQIWQEEVWHIIIYRTLFISQQEILLKLLLFLAVLLLMPSQQIPLI